MCIFACIHHRETAENMSVLSVEKVKGETDTVQVMIATPEQKVIGYLSFFFFFFLTSIWLVKAILDCCVQTCS